MYLCSDLSSLGVLRSQWRIMGKLSLSMLSGTAASWTSCVTLRRRRETNLKTASWKLRRFVCLFVVFLTVVQQHSGYNVSITFNY